MIATEAIIQSLALSGMPPNMLPLEGETLTPDDIDLFERAQAAQANKPFVPTLAAPSGGSGQPPSAMPTDSAVPLIPAQAAPLDAPSAMPMQQSATPAGFQLGTGILQQPTQPTRSDDPFGNLSKQQRMMLAFSAISDAGMAAQGKEGTSFARTLKAFGEMSDSQRKRDAAAQRQQMLQRVMGGGAAVGGSIADMNVEQLMQRQQALANYAIANPSMAQGIAPTMDIIEARIAQLKETGSAATLGSLGLDAIKKLIDSPDIGQITGTSAVINSLLERFNLAPRYSDLMSFVDQLAGINFMEAYVQLKGGGQITEIESEKATAARTRLDRALKGTPEDLKVALLELEGLFKDALSKNPSYTEEGGINEEDRRFFEEAK
tara:strand:- start:2064 stop:3194 length:1131 start_codon:yes stop_codon:yes gene_type:complete